MDNYTNIAPVRTYSTPPGRSVFYVCTNVTFNGKTPKHKIVANYWKSFRPEVDGETPVGGFNVQSNSRVGYGHFDAYSPYYGLTNNETIWTNISQVSAGRYTNGWIILMDRNNNGNVGDFNKSTGEYRQNVGEKIHKVHFEGIPTFPSSGTGPVEITSIDLSGYMDVDNDGIPDYWEKQNELYTSFHNIIDTTNFSPSQDYDGDGMNDLEEYIAGTNPTNANSPNSQFSLNVNPSPSISFNSLEGRLYNVEKATNLVESNAWKPYSTNIVGNDSELVLPITNNAPAEYFRVKAKLSPDSF
jgi:hypothetical protein